MAFKSSQIEAIVFDAYGTLFDPNSIGQRITALLPEQAEDVLRTWREKQLQYTWLRTLMGRYQDFYTVTEEALRYALMAHDCALTASATRQLMSAYYELEIYAEVKPALTELSANYKLAILSNANPSLLERATENTDIASHFDKVLSADVIQKFKPTPEIYGLAGSQLNIPDTAILFVSSNTWDIAGAASSGLATAWVNRQGTVAEQLGFTADIVLQSLSALPGVLHQ